MNNSKKERTKTWKNLLAYSLAPAIALIVSGCAYTHIQRPLDSNFNATELGTKEGRAHSYSILWVVAWGNAGTKAAAIQGGIRTIRHADTEVKLVLMGAYTRVTTVIYGD